MNFLLNNFLQEEDEINILQFIKIFNADLAKAWERIL